MNKNLCLIVLILNGYYSLSQVGIGTTNPQAQLEVSGGNVRFSNYGTGTVTGVETYLLGVDSDGDIVESSLNSINQPGLQYYTWDIANTTEPNIDNKRTLGIPTSQGVFNGDLDDTARTSIEPDNIGYILNYVGTIRVENTGVFTFNARSDDGSRIYIDNVLVVENWSDQSPVTISNSVTLARGEHRIEFWYYQNTGGGFMQFTWGTNPDSYTVNSTINANQFFVK
ncbi:PA14 domain-containing protein [Flavivirga aquimarina]|uniref:PA14 domain-containing protein n=1 Tax=Flavivirga aquimarina TaxID=2027862 RepID=A0ABT8WEP5_9FLAO|nr:PA14 domain-containing protein [Flavivirga aquimarina]MDO5971583.1 PA14 domain-containing protein [Flavivirga aquimarina]